MAETSPARCVSEREKGGDFAPAGSKGRSPWRFFGDFLIGEKVTRVQGGAPAYRGSQGPPSLQNSPGRGAERPHWRSRDPRPCKIPRGVGRSARIRRRRSCQLHKILPGRAIMAQKRRGKFLAFWGMSGATPPDYFFVYLPSFSKTVLSSVETLNSLLAAKSCSALAAFWMLVSVPAPPTQPPGQAMPSSR